MTDEIGQIGYNPSSLFNTQDILEFAKQLDFKPQVNSIWIPESWGREAFVMLGAIGAITRRIKLGTSIVSMFSRSPATLAMAASTLDNISLNHNNWNWMYSHSCRKLARYQICTSTKANERVCNMF